MLETLCLQMSNRSNDCCNIIGNHQECFHKPAKCLHPLQSDLPDCEGLAVGLGLIIYLFIYFSFSATCPHSDRCTELFFFFFLTESYTLLGSPRQIDLGLGWQCSGFFLGAGG